MVSILMVNTCECGCGQLVKNHFISGHNIRVNNPMNSLEAQQKIGEANRNRIWSLEARQKIGKANKIRVVSLGTRQKLSQAFVRRWQDPNYREKMLPKLAETGRRIWRPTNGETILGSILMELGYPYRYTGNGEVVLCGMFPDFWWEEEQRVIEFYGSYWHEPKNEPERIDNFAKLDILCLIIWDYELRDIEKVKNKIRVWHKISKFSGGGGNSLCQDDVESHQQPII